VHLVERLCSFYHLDIHRHPRERAGMRECGGSAVGARYIVRGRKDTTQTVLNIKRAQGCCPWSPPQEGARDQSSSARRGLPSKGEARALHHQPAPASTLTIALLFALYRNLSSPSPLPLLSLSLRRQRERAMFCKQKWHRVPEVLGLMQEPPATIPTPPQKKQNR